MNEEPEEPPLVPIGLLGTEGNSKETESLN